MNNKEISILQAIFMAVSLFLMILSQSISLPLSTHDEIHNVPDDDKPWEELSVNDSTVIDLVKYYNETFLEKLNSKNWYSVNISSILTARRKNNRYQTFVELSHWDCRHSDCRVIKTQNCNFTILPRTVVHRPAALPFDCYESQFKPLPVQEAPGGMIRIDRNDSNLLKAIENALEYIVKLQSGPVETELLEVLEATSQSTEVLLYRTLAKIELTFYMRPPIKKICYFEMEYNSTSNNHTVVHHDCNCLHQFT